MARKPRPDVVRAKYSDFYVSNADAVGYCAPPKAHRFKKGRSGNPRGRPRKNPMPAVTNTGAFQEMLLRVGQEPVKMTKADGASETISTMEAIVRRLAHKAASGDQRAAKMFLDAHASAAAAQTDQVDTGRNLVIGFVHHTQTGKFWELSESMKASLMELAVKFAPEYLQEVEDALERHENTPTEKRQNNGVIVIHPPRDSDKRGR